MTGLALINRCHAADFNRSILNVLKHEGFLEYDKADPGGITNYGLSIRYLKDLVKHHPEAASLLETDGFPGVDDNDVKNMPIEEAIKVYRLYWWTPAKLNDIKHQPLADKIFDLSVNMGAGQVNKLMARAYGQMCKGCVVTTQRINALTKAQSQKLLYNLCYQGDLFYRDLAEKHPSYKKFLNGWLKRVWDGVK